MSSLCIPSSLPFPISVLSFLCPFLFSPSSLLPPPPPPPTPFFLSIHPTNLCEVCPVLLSVLGTHAPSPALGPGRNERDWQKALWTRCPTNHDVWWSGCESGLSSCPWLSLTPLALKCMGSPGPFWSCLGVYLQWLFCKFWGYFTSPVWTVSVAVAHEDKQISSRVLPPD